MPNAAARSAKSAASAKKKPRAKLNLADLDVGEVTEAPGAFDGGPGPDHPLTVAFEKSFHERVPVSISTKTPDLVEKVVRRMAVKKEVSARVRRGTDAVVIEVREKTARAPKVETASDEEAR